jgi:SAM-dependent methyltransferase
MAARADGTRVFDEVAEGYARQRPEYDPALVEDVVALSGLPQEGRILEIGCGPGKATLPFAERGYAMLCLDPGPRLVALARARVQAYPRVQFQVTTFEDWPLEEGAFDLVMAASAFHWVDAVVGYPKVAAALKPGGAFALFRNGAVDDESNLYAEIQEAYRVHAPDLARPRPAESGVDGQRAELEATGLFHEVLVRAHPGQRTYTAEEYVELLDTYSGHRSLPADTREALSAAIREVILRHGGVITRHHVGRLHVARKA